MHIRGARGTKEFQFDQVFTSEHSQDGIFEDTKVHVHVQCTCKCTCVNVHVCIHIILYRMFSPK